MQRIDEHDISTFTGNNGEQVSQVMGDSRSYEEYKRQYELAEDKCKFNAEWFEKQGRV